ncbi:MAG: prenyltransferase [Acidobacteria bacterium]|nr:prenyltransferase [Acidobacteriota bacterium]
MAAEESGNDLRYIIGVMRPRFLLLAVACVFLGLAAAVWAGYGVNPWHALLCFAGGVLAHGGVNAFNEYEDIKSGLDFRTERTPFSGGSGTLVPVPHKLPIALWTGIVTAAVCVAIGVYFYLLYGWPILAIGALGLFVIVVYTPWLNRVPLLCLVAPGLGFGTLMVNGTYFALTGAFSWTALAVSFVPFFLVSNLLLLNQFPDVEADRTVGRKHLPIAIGRKASARVFALFVAATYLTILLGVALRLMPPWTLISLVSLLFALPAARGALAHPDNLARLGPSLGQNVLANLAAPVLVGIGLLLG